MPLFSPGAILGAQASGYKIGRSLRFRASASAYLSRTPGSASNQTTWTWSAWVKRGALTTSGNFTLFSAGVAAQPYFLISFSSDQLAFDAVNSGSVVVGRKYTTQVFRDPSAWYHIVCVWDTSNATASSRMRVYVNGSQVTAFSLSTDPSLNATTQVNTTAAHLIGSYPGGGNYFDGYLADINFIDGQALTPSSFGESNATTGVWQPKAYTGTYGTNGFYLKFADNSGATATTIGKDSSGNGNNWTPTNISVTAGTTYDSMIDTPTPYDDGGNGVGNYCTLNPLRNSGAASGTFSNANLQLSGTNGAINTYGSGSQAISGKMYFEITATTIGTASSGGIGVVPVASSQTTTANTMSAGIYYIASGNKRVTGTSSAYGSSYTNGDVIGVAVDATAETVTFYKNNVSQGSISGTGVIASGVLPYIGFDDVNSPVFVANFGQRPFTYTPPSGFKALNTQNLPTPTIAAGGNYMAAVLYNGTSASNTVVATSSNSGNNPLALTFQPDLVWIKSRSAATNHELTDAVRGVTKSLVSNSTAAEATDTNGLTAFTSTGFTVGSDSNYNNGTGPATYVAWEWKGGNGTVSNTSGSITSTVSANATAGFSVVTWTMSNNAVNYTIGHGLGVTPSLIIVKNRSIADNWWVWTDKLASATDSYLLLNGTAAAATAASLWGTGATSSVIGARGSSMCSGANQNLVAYCFAAVAGYSAFGSYTGNGSADGPFVFTGFRPRFILWKSTTNSAQGWFTIDTSRDTYNVTGNVLQPNGSTAEANYGAAIDILSNGFKLRSTLAGYNENSGTYIYAAFAENPFSKALAR